jgi:hypothetical protein
MLLFMQTIELTIYELAKQIEDQAPRFLKKGELGLLHRAQELTQAKAAWDELRKMSNRNDLESSERAKTTIACIAFSKEWESFRMSLTCTEKNGQMRPE